jgi:dienelactone hydrolase
MKSLSLLLTALLLALPSAARCQTTPAWSPDRSLQKVATLLLTWHDAARNREVPVKIYYPASAKSPCPMVIFSHGLGGSREGYSYLGERWAGDGYISVHIQHLGSDDAVWKDAGIAGFAQLSAAAANPINALNRALDVTFAIDQMLALNKQPTSPFRGLVDKNEIGMAGHSFGAWTTLAVLGEKTASGKSLVDPRIKSAIAMSAPVPVDAKKPGVFAAIAVPVFHMTGTLDDSPIGETVAADRRVPYDQSTVPGTCLLILNGADHMVFSGRMFGGFRQTDAGYQALILPASVAFWEATLRGDKSAHEWLYNGGFKTLLGTQGTFEIRPGG